MKKISSVDSIGISGGLMYHVGSSYL